MTVITDLPRAITPAALAGKARDTLSLTWEERRWTRKRVDDHRRSRGRARPAHRERARAGGDPRGGGGLVPGGGGPAGGGAGLLPREPPGGAADRVRRGQSPLHASRSRTGPWWSRTTRRCPNSSRAWGCGGSAVRACTRRSAEAVMTDPRLLLAAALRGQRAAHRRLRALVRARALLPGGAGAGPPRPRALPAHAARGRDRPVRRHRGRGCAARAHAGATSGRVTAWTRSSRP